MISSEELLGDRTGPDEMSERSYLFVLGLYVVGGLIASALCAMSTYTWQMPNIWVILGLGLAVPIVGILISVNSKELGDGSLLTCCFTKHYLSDTFSSLSPDRLGILIPRHSFHRYSR